METAQEEMAQKRKKLHGKPASIYSQEELRRQQELLFEQVHWLNPFPSKKELFVHFSRLEKNFNNWKKMIGLRHKSYPKKFYERNWKQHERMMIIMMINFCPVSKRRSSLC
jgi:hypothetical protein